jgi:trans-aconitate methyltransferase
MDLKESALLGEDAAHHWYYRSKAAAMVRYLGQGRPRRVLDVGAGSGFFTRYLLDRGLVDSGVCVDTGYASDREERVGGRMLSFRRSIERDDADLVLLMDVLEHVDDDVELLASYVTKVSPYATFLVTVPAHQWLWSEHDVFLEHRRRYDIAMLEQVMARAQLRVVKSNYYFGLVLPIAVAVRLAGRFATSTNAAPRSQLVRHGRMTNFLLGALCRVELPLIRVNRVAGLTIFCLARRSG